MEGFVIAGVIVGFIMQFCFLLAAWRAAQAHENLARSIDDFVGLQIRKDKRERKVDE